MYEVFNLFVKQLFPECTIDLTIVEYLLRSRRVYRGEYLFQEGELCNYVGLTVDASSASRIAQIFCIKVSNPWRVTAET